MSSKRTPLEGGTEVGRRVESARGRGACGGIKADGGAGMDGDAPNAPHSNRMRLRGYALSRPLLRSLSLRPGDSSSSRRETLSIGFRVLVSRHPAIQTTGLLTLAPAGLSPAEHASLRWTHNRTCGSPASYPVLPLGDDGLE